MARKAKGRDEVFRGSLELIPSVKCAICGKSHLADSEGFMTFYGNVTLGTNGGIIGNNFDEKGNLEKSTVICLTPSCMSLITDKIAGYGALHRGTPDSDQAPVPPRKKK